MKKPKPKSNTTKPESTSHTYGLDEQDSTASAQGAPIRGFEEDDQYEEYRGAGFSFSGTADTNADLVSDEGNDEPPVPEGESSAGDPDIGILGSLDLRFGGEDISGVSEWSMRARALELDDGLDAGDFKRPDKEIAQEIFDAFQEEELDITNFECEVAGAEVTMRGIAASSEARERMEDMIKDLPGVKEVSNLIEVRGLPKAAKSGIEKTREKQT